MTGTGPGLAPHHHRCRFRRFNVEGFPYDWHIAVHQIVGEGQRAASWIEITG